MNSKDLVYIAIILAILAIAVWIGRRDGRKLEQLRNQAELLQREVDGLTASRDTALSRAKVESEQRVKIVLQKDSEQADLKAQVAFWKQRVRIADKKPSVAPTTSDSSQMAKISYPCAERDSVIEVQDKLVMSLETSQAEITASYDRQLAQMDSALKSQAQVAEVWRVGNQESQRKLRREVRRKKLFRGLAVVGGVVVGVLLISGK